MDRRGKHRNAELELTRTPLCESCLARRGRSAIVAYASAGQSSSSLGISGRLLRWSPGGSAESSNPASEFKPSFEGLSGGCLLYTSPSPRDRTRSRMPSSA
eukprot:TRINITY_DN1004_c0_g1_i1.p3 TRINITY_DN1004_c0_g1~~TRINITY_DN1004_c0_g1_i1.p3  ORF type:complete len:101 (+),score=1.72 TRINITY_DN1004_c0_g1_i1:105-407(+)